MLTIFPADTNNNNNNNKQRARTLRNKDKERLRQVAEREGPSADPAGLVGKEWLLYETRGNRRVRVRIESVSTSGVSAMATFLEGPRRGVTARIMTEALMALPTDGGAT